MSEKMKNDKPTDAVSREQLIEWMENYRAVNKYYHPYSKTKNIPFDEVIRIIKEIPPAMPKQWTCKDCAWWNKENHHCRRCNLSNANEGWDVVIHKKTKEDFYCAGFKRKEEGD